MVYDLLDKDLREYYIPAHKWCFISWGLLSVVLGVVSFFNNGGIVLAIMAMLVTLVFFVTWNVNKRRYGNTLLYKGGIIKIYNYKNMMLREYTIDSMQSCYVLVGFPAPYGRFTYKKCLILYNDVEIYDKMEYPSYWKDPEMIIMENPQLIEVMDKVLRENSQDISCISE